ncbi:hypothetical protein [Latilactobacillus sakei]|uniref:hypothetical protein n=1 Tax=Latilactobacillus sakei TaxID=1599 RepID=UPI000DC646BD|nr:hypothetical protein [Latilactobacillus sakei]SPS04289.1 hypothetical protein LAS9624_01129 [Latilactobacillus sakei]
MDAIITTKTGKTLKAWNVSEVKSMDFSGNLYSLKAEKFKDFSMNDLNGNLTIVGNSIISVRPEDVETVKFDLAN